MNQLLSALLLLLVANVCALAQAPVTLQLKFADYHRSSGPFRLKVNGANVHVRSVSQPVRGTNYKVAEFNRMLGVSGRERTDISELVLIHERTGRKVTLVLGKDTEIPAPDEPAPPLK
jgi:hypothetical protein